LQWCLALGRLIWWWWLLQIYCWSFIKLFEWWLEITCRVEHKACSIRWLKKQGFHLEVNSKCRYLEAKWW
jgi:hypothetical protein